EWENRSPVSDSTPSTIARRATSSENGGVLTRESAIKRLLKNLIVHPPRVYLAIYGRARNRWSPAASKWHVRKADNHPGRRFRRRVCRIPPGKTPRQAHGRRNHPDYPRQLLPVHPDAARSRGVRAGTQRHRQPIAQAAAPHQDLHRNRTVDPSRSKGRTRIARPRRSCARTTL